MLSTFGSRRLGESAKRDRRSIRFNTQQD